jgi:PIN domain nuclease of toxin-antitoxin system
VSTGSGGAYARASGIVHPVDDVVLRRRAGEASAELPLHHADPFDRVLIAQAAFAEYGVRLAPPGS